MRQLDLGDAALGKERVCLEIFGFKDEVVHWAGGVVFPVFFLHFWIGKRYVVNWSGSWGLVCEWSCAGVDPFGFEVCEVEMGIDLKSVPISLCLAPRDRLA